jgi:hypothetical protein
MKRFFTGLAKWNLWVLSWCGGCYIADAYIPRNTEHCWVMAFGVLVFCCQESFVLVWDRWFGGK